MTSQQLFKGALGQATSTIRCVQSRHFGNPTPCTDWNCGELVNHMLYELSWVPDLLEGKTVAEVGSKYDGDLLDNRHHHNWHLAAHKAMDVINKTPGGQPVHLSYGDVSTEQYIREVSADLLIHAWDTAQSYNCSLILDPDMTQDLYDGLLPRKATLASNGAFAAAIEVPGDARLQTKLLALLGRREPAIN